MDVNIKIKVKPFAVPNFVLVESDGPEPPQTFALSQMSANALEKLCDQFKCEVFKKAKKSPPPIIDRA